MTNRPQTLYEIYAAPRSCVERAYPKLIHYNKLDKGGHFAAWEQPEVFGFGDARGIPDHFANLQGTSA